MSSAHFRAGTVAVVKNSEGEILAFERSDVPEQWQLPQGGIDADEEPVDGVWRELEEETGLTSQHVRLVAEYPEWTIYEWPDHVNRKKGRLGQAQRWFFFEVKNDDCEPIPDGVEFVGWRWVAASWLIDQIVEFRRASYQRVLGES